MSWLIAHIDAERKAPDSEQALSALLRPSLPEPELTRLLEAPHCVLGLAQSNSSPARSPDWLFSSGEHGLYIVADIRIDNRRELREALSISRHDISDIELLAEGYLRFGADIADKIIGGFAFVIWNARARTLYAARDAMGERPLYYTSQGPRLSLATSVEQLLCTFDRLPELDDETIFGFLGGEYPRIESTFFRTIRRLPPGHFLVARFGDEPRVERYFHPPASFLELPRREDYEDRFRDLLREAVRARIDDTESPILLHLSGGLDSTSIASLAERIHGSSSKLRLVSALYPGLDCDESEFIRAAMEGLNLPWEGFDAMSFDWKDLEDPFLDWPGGRSSQAGSDGDLSIARREGARILLSGFGGDDIGSEAGIFRDLASLGRFPTLLRETLMAREFHWGGRRRMFLDGMKGILPHAFHTAYLQYRPARRGAPPAWLGPRLREIWPGPREEFHEMTHAWLSHSQRWLFRAFSNANRAWCVDIELRHAEEAGVEVRYPFFDRRLADFVLSIPPEHRLPSGSYRVLQRRAMRGLLPEAILSRHQPTTFETAFFARARESFSHFRPFFEEGDFLSAPYIDRAVLKTLSRRLESYPSRIENGPSFRLFENAALLESWLRALRAQKAKPLVSRGRGSMISRPEKLHG